jgi:hypothetical protein
VEVLYDDRDAGPGEKFADAELLGCPLRLTVGRRTLESGRSRCRCAAGSARPGPVPLEASGGCRRGGRAVARASPRPRAPCRRRSRRLFGIDRSGPPPPRRPAGQPLRPWTLPNAIGFARLALIPVFLVVALSSRDGAGRARGDRCSP